VVDGGRMIGSMWQSTETVAINRRTPRENGAPNRARGGLGRSAQVGWHSPVSAPVSPWFLLA
jgi:hypothetical protein